VEVLTLACRANASDALTLDVLEEVSKAHLDILESQSPLESRWIPFALVGIL